MKHRIFGVLMLVGIACLLSGFSWQYSIGEEVARDNASKENSYERRWEHAQTALSGPAWNPPEKRQGDYTPVYFLYGVGAIACLLGVFALALPAGAERKSGNAPAPPAPVQPSVSSAKPLAAEVASLGSYKDAAERDAVRAAAKEEREKREREVDEVIAKRLRYEREELERVERETLEAETELRNIRSSERLALFNRVISRSFLVVRSSLDESIGRVPAALMLLAVGVVGLVFWLMIMREIPLTGIPIAFLGIVAVVAVWFPSDKRLKSMLVSADKSLMECEQSRVIYEKHLAGVADKLMTEWVHQKKKGRIRREANPPQTH
jgi:hypothetical protein